MIRKDSGVVHFFVNGVDQGVAASNVPENVYGVIDLYGQAAQATIVDQSGKAVITYSYCIYFKAEIADSKKCWFGRHLAVVFLTYCSSSSLLLKCCVD